MEEGNLKRNLEDQIYGESKKISSVRVLWKGKVSKQSTGDFENSEYTVVLDTFITHLTEPIKGTTARENLMICRCSYILGNKCNILVSDVDNEVGYTCVEAGNIWEISVPEILLKF